MIEAKIIEYLTNKNLVGSDVYAEEPSNPPTKYIRIEKTAGGCRNKIYSAMVAIQSYADTLYNASELNSQVIEAMETFAGNVDNIYICELNSDYNYTDTETKRYRYQAVFNIYYS